jgi:hypothetical protein
MLEKEDDSILTELRQTYKGKDWFYDAGYDQYGRPVIYVKFDCHETIWHLPNVIQGKQLLVHLAASIVGSKEDFFVKPTNGHGSLPLFISKVVTAATPAAVKPSVVETMEDTEEQERELELSVQALTDELDRLEKLCGSNILQEIFYEVHDGKNKVTNMSARYPVIEQDIKKLYDKYGFDTIYEELDG